MYWVICAIIACIATFFLGYHFRGLTQKIDQLEAAVRSKLDKQPEPEDPKSELIDPYDPVQTAIYEREKMLKRLNPDG